MSEFLLDAERRNSITIEQLATLILKVLKRNHAIQNGAAGMPYISYYPYSTNSIKEFELLGRSDIFTNRDKEFEGKFAEAVHHLQHRGYIMRDPKQDSSEFQVPTRQGLAVETSKLEVGLASSSDFSLQVEKAAGSLDPVAKAYLQESFNAASHGLWISSSFMLGAASERLIHVLSDHVDYLRSDATAHAELAKVNGVRQRKEWIISQLGELKRSFPIHKAAFTDVEDKFDSLYNSYRYQRNAAGHPVDTLIIPEAAQVKAMLYSFEIYAKAVNQILSIP